jgi:hypothetical protein
MSPGPKLADRSQSLFLVRDNNFGPTQFTQVLAFSLDISLGSLAITLGGVTLAQGDDLRGPPFPLVSTTGSNVQGIDYQAAIGVAAFGFGANELEFDVGPLYTKFFALDSNGAVAFQGLLTPLQAGLPLLGAALSGLGAIASRRGAVRAR